jgi:tRNA (cmo5U34)-methyltransferase
MNGFDLLAPVYDSINRFVFGKSMINAQIFFLNRVAPGDRVLILGGGTGWLLEELLRNQPDCEIWYVESSLRMIALAKRKCDNYPNVHFVLGTESSIPPIMFDVVIMNFFLDLFSETKISLLLERIKTLTQPEGVWIVTDFKNEGKAWQYIVAAVMIVFFKLICAIEATKLPDLESLFNKHRMHEISSSAFFYGFIKTGVYAKT